MNTVNRFVVASATGGLVDTFPTKELADAQASVWNWRYAETAKTHPWTAVEVELPVADPSQLALVA